jgi:hypothetical protein
MEVWVEDSFGVFNSVVAYQDPAEGFLPELWDFNQAGGQFAEQGLIFRVANELAKFGKVGSHGEDTFLLTELDKVYAAEVSDIIKIELGALRTSR